MANNTKQFYLSDIELTEQQIEQFRIKLVKDNKKMKEWLEQAIQQYIQ